MKAPCHPDRQLSAVGSRLQQQRRMLALGVMDVTALIVHQTARGEWNHVAAAIEARRFLMRALQIELPSAEELSCLAALFAAVEESEQTLRAIMPQGRS